jgi:hypothetical protein
VGTLLVWALFVGSAAATIMQHLQFATGTRRRHFFAFLETSGWLTLTFASGIAALRLAPGALSIGTGVVGFLLVLVGSLLRPSNRAAATASEPKRTTRG